MSARSIAREAAPVLLPQVPRRRSGAHVRRRRRAEPVPPIGAELAHAARWNAMGMMVATLAHELNQPLTAAANFLEAARQALAGAEPDGPAALDLAGKAATQARQACAIVANLREFIDRRETGRTFEDINQVIEGAMTLASVRAAQFGAEVRVSLGEGLPRILLNRVEIQQVLVNLFRNAMEAMRASDRRVLTIATEWDGPDAVTVSVSDSGPGVDPAVLARLFQPFATGKQNGMGLGLRICQTIVEAHEGRIRVTPNEREGVTFRFRLPVVDPDALE